MSSINDDRPSSTTYDVVPPLRVPEPTSVTSAAGSPGSTAQGRVTKMLRMLATLLVGAGVGAGTAFVGLRVLRHGGNAAPAAHHLNVVVLVALVVALGMFVILLHELGHVLGGRLAGMRFVALVIGPVRFVRVDGRVRAQWSNRLFGGAAICAPERWEGARAFRRAMRRFVGGGPLTSLVVGGVALALFAGLHPAALARDSWWMLLVLGGVMSLGIGVVTLIPISGSGAGGTTDGAQLLRFREPRGDAAHGDSPVPWYVPFSAVGAMAALRRPREWDTELVRLLEETADRPGAVVGVLCMSYYRALDAGDLPHAAKRLQQAVDRAYAEQTLTSRVVQGVMAVEGAVFESVWRDDLDRARAWMTHAGHGAERHRSGQLIVQAMELRARGERDAAREELAVARQENRRGGFPSAVLMNLATIERAEARIDEAVRGEQPGVGLGSGAGVE
ncbi:MAG TPA: M50 family metallopeptidase [Gemmatimonadaceae bacterium]|nr:M50 family metallopeptidase [Gemmatimonadaceae bacterium]